MRNESIEITVDIGMGKKNFTTYTMDLTKDYIEINADYRSQHIELELIITRYLL